MTVPSIFGGAQCAALAAEPVQVARGVSPDRRFAIVLEADLDTPRYQTYEFKGGDDQFPAFQVLNLRSGRSLIRVPWPGDSSSKIGMAPLRERTTVLWRGDSRAVAINTRDPYYWSTILLVWNERDHVFVNVPLPGFEAVAGRPVPRPEDLRARRVEEALRWTAKGELLYYLALDELRPLGYPLTYRVVLSVAPDGCRVLSREAVSQER